MPWRPLPRIVFAVAIYPFQPSSPADLPLELGDELYVIEEGGAEWDWFRGYLVAPPSLLAGLSSSKGQTLEARVFSGIFPKSCVEVREVLGGSSHDAAEEASGGDRRRSTSKSRNSSLNRRPTVSRGTSQQGRQAESDASASNGKLALVTAGLGTPAPSRARSKSSSPQGARRSPSRRNVPTLPLTPVSLSPNDADGPRPPAPVPMLKIGDETPTSSSEPLVDEIASCLREWHSTNLHELLLSRRYNVLESLSTLVNQLDLSRRQLLHGVLTKRELEVLREKTVWDLVKGNRMLGNEVIVRCPKQRGRLLTSDDTAIAISKLQSTMSLLDQAPVTTVEKVKLQHLMMELKGVVNGGREVPMLCAYLCSWTPGDRLKVLTEPFAIEVPLSDQYGKAAAAGKLKTLFIDLVVQDIQENQQSNAQVYLVVKVQSNKLSNPAALFPTKTSPPAARAHTVKVKRTTSSPLSASKSSAGKSTRRSLMWSGGRNRQEDANAEIGSLPTTHARHESSQDHEISPAGATDQPDRPSSGGSAGGEADRGPQYIKRSLGAAVLPLNAILSSEDASEHILTVWTPNEQKADDEEPWDVFVEEILRSQAGAFRKSKVVNRIKVSLQPFISSDAESLIRTTPTLLHNIHVTHSIGFVGAPTKPRSDIYLTVSEPVLPPQALFSHPERGTVALPIAPSMQNLQLTLEVRRSSTGQRIENCIFPSSNSAGHTAWRSVAVERGESWSQHIKLVIPSDEVPDAHLIMSVAEAPEFPFALAWMPLWDHGAFVQDARHMPLLYIYDKTTSRQTHGRGVYLDYPWDSKPHERIADVENLKTLAALKVETYLCSTMFSQDKTLLAVLKWKDQGDDQLLALLRQLVFVPEIEIVKLLSDVFDALFGILVDRSGNDEYEDLVFMAIVTVLGIVHDRRFNLGPLVDEYIKMRFNYPFATPCLIRSYLRLLQRPTDYQNARNLRSTFKVGRQTMKFIVTARSQQKAKEAGIGITNTQAAFSRDFTKIFLAFEKLMREQSPFLIGSKTLLVQYMHTWLPEMKGCFTEEAILHLAARFINACDQVQGKLILYKLVLILNLSRDAAALDSNLREPLDTKIAAWIAPYWGLTETPSEQYREQVRLCCSILALRSDLGTQSGEYFMKAVESYRCIRQAEKSEGHHLSLLFPTTYPFPSKVTAGERNYDECLVELAALMSTFSARSLIREAQASGKDLAMPLTMALEAASSILTGEAFPDSWLTLHVYHHRSILQMLETVFEVLSDHYLPSPDDADDFPTDIWKAYLVTLLTLVRSDALALETFPEQKRRAVWKIAGDVREQGAGLLSRSWDAIGWDASPEERTTYKIRRVGGFQVQYVPSLVGPIVELCMSVHEGLRHIAVGVLQSMIVSEWTLNEDLAVVQAEVINALDTLFKSKNVSEIAQEKLFVGELMHLFAPLAQTAKDGLWEAIKSLVSVVEELLDRLVAVHDPEMTEASQIMSTLKLMDFLKGMEKKDIFMRYVHQLVDIQVAAKYFTEAGLALQLHADAYTWDTTNMADELSKPRFPRQSHFDRKEQLYFDMIKYYEDGRSWEHALDCYAELAEQYENHVFDYAKLARTQRSTARIHELIARGEINSPRFFRVVFRGLGFPTALREKHFIYQGHDSERLASFTDRLQQKYPTAQIVGHGDIDHVEGQYIQIAAVNANKDLAHPVLQIAKVPHSTRDFLTSLHPCEFSVTFRRHSPKSGVKGQWIEKTVYTTAESFPTILRRSEVVAEDIITLSPLETALERTTRRTTDLAVLEKRIKDGESASFAALTEAIRSSVEPHSQNSVAQYRDLLFHDAHEAADDDAAQKALELSLKHALLDFASTLRRCLLLYARPEFAQLHRTLTAQFLSTFEPEMAVLAPTWRSSTDAWLLSPHDDLNSVHESVPTEEGPVSDTPDLPPPASHLRSASFKNGGAASGSLFSTHDSSTHKESSEAARSPEPVSAGRSEGPSLEERLKHNPHHVPHAGPLPARVQTVSVPAIVSKGKSGSIRKTFSTLRMSKKPSRATIGTKMPESLDEE